MSPESNNELQIYPNDPVFDLYFARFALEMGVIVDESFKCDFRVQSFRDNMDRFISVWTNEFSNCKGIKGKFLFELLVSRYEVCCSIIRVIDS